MTARGTFVRKIVYCSIVVVLLSTLAWISPPATSGAKTEGGSPGGKLSQLRNQYGLSQANLGEIDPTSEAIKLATLGMRGVAANLLWTKANHYFKTKDWTAFSATIQQIIKLQPNFVGVWRYQGWNEAYNVSIEWDDYRDRYFWVIKGINFLKEGTRYNENEPILLWDVGWTTGHKIGRADERVQFRRLFREDDVFHGDRPVSQRDNWMVGKESFLAAQELIDTKGIPLRQMNPLLFHTDIPLWQVNYASALEEEGSFGEVARLAWDRGEREWRALGDRDIPTIDNQTLRMNDFDSLLLRQTELMAEVDALAPGVREQVYAAKLEALPSRERELIERDPAERTAVEQTMAEEVAYQLTVYTEDIVARTKDSPHAAQLEELAERHQQLGRHILAVDNWRNITKYPQWLKRCAAERTEAAIEARRLGFEADRLFHDEAELEAARDSYVQALARWREVLDQYPELRIDTVVGEELCDLSLRYQDCLRQLDETLPQPYILQDVLDANQQYMNLPR